jgi:hypothetical protein
MTDSGPQGVPEAITASMICAECGFVLYDNPKIVVGSVALGRPDPAAGGLLIRGAAWTLPAGYLE